MNLTRVRNERKRWWIIGLRKNTACCTKRNAVGALDSDLSRKQSNPVFEQLGPEG